MQGYDASTYGDAFADVYDDWYGDVSPPAATAAFMAARTDGLVVELGSGTGRLARALIGASVPTVGLDASGAMAAASRDRVPELPVVTADMVAPPLRPGCAAGVLVAFNTLFNLPTAALQSTALARARELVAPDGIVVVETFVPGDGAAVRSDAVDVVRISTDAVVLRVSRTVPDGDRSGTVSGHHVELRDGDPVRLRPWHLRYTDPEGLDRLATDAGLAAAERFGGWSETPFDEASEVQVTVYRPAPGHR